MARKNGPLIIVVILVFGVLFVGGLFFFAGRVREQRYEESAIGAAEVPQRFVAYDGMNQPRQAMIDEIREAKADFVLLTHVPEAELAGLQKKIEFGKSKLARVSRDGVAILTRHYIYNGGPVANTSKAIWAEGLVLGRRFVVAAGEFGAGDLQALHAAWRARSSPPLVMGGLLDADAAAALPAEWKLITNEDALATPELMWSKDWMMQNMKSATTARGLNWVELKSRTAASTRASKE